jgi:hypothetical protein
VWLCRVGPLHGVHWYELEGLGIVFEFWIRIEWYC